MSKIPKWEKFPKLDFFQNIPILLENKVKYAQNNR